jgi:hypothetical protein
MAMCSVYIGIAECFFVLVGDIVVFLLYIVVRSKAAVGYCRSRHFRAAVVGSSIAARAW